jgi:hypothetical protein
MIRVGELYENPVTGQRVVVRVPPRRSNGHRLVADLYVQPGERWAQLIRQRFLLAQDGRTDRWGRPGPLRAAALGWEFADAIRFTTLPRPFQRLLVAALYPIARATGHRAVDPAYLRRELPTVELEPLPAEIAERIPSLSTRPRFPNSTTVAAR